MSTRQLTSIISLAAVVCAAEACAVRDEETEDTEDTENIGTTASEFRAPGAAKFQLIGPGVALDCNTLMPVPREPAYQTARGFVFYRQNVWARTVSAYIAVKGWAPNTSHPVRLIQGGAGGIDCYTQDGVFKTDSHGNGSLYITEPLRRGAHSLQVIIDTESMYSLGPTFRGTEPYALQ